MGLSLVLVPTQTLRLEQRLGLRLALHLAFSQEKYTPDGKCPGCGYKLTPTEVLQGFTRDPNDYTTQCPRTVCKERFPARQVLKTQGTRLELPFYCAVQTLAQLPELQKLSPEEIKKDHGAIFHSAVYHFGNIQKAFEECGVRYAFTLSESPDWREKALDFLGQIPDTVIASFAGVLVKEVRKLRKEKGFSAWNK